MRTSITLLDLALVLDHCFRNEHTSCRPPTYEPEQFSELGASLENPDMSIAITATLWSSVVWGNAGDAAWSRHHLPNDGPIGDDDYRITAKPTFEWLSDAADMVDGRKVNVDQVVKGIKAERDKHSVMNVEISGGVMLKGHPIESLTNIQHLIDRAPGTPWPTVKLMTSEGGVHTVSIDDARTYIEAIKTEHNDAHSAANVLEARVRGWADSLRATDRTMADRATDARSLIAFNEAIPARFSAEL